jgi:DNA-binding transcriptional regulator YiaG
MFGYRCANCNRGTVKAQTVQNFETKFDGIPFVVPNATVGVCDYCGTRNLSAQEWRRWREQFRRSQEAHGRLLSAGEITELREGLGLGIGDFAKLIGSSRQPIYSWECPSREVPQSRMADLMLRLVRESHIRGAVNVIEYLALDANVRCVGAPQARASRHSPRQRHGVHQRTDYDLNAHRYGILFRQSSQPAGFSPVLRAIAR